MRKFTIPEFINRANKTHHNFYNYNSVVYKNCNEKVEIICPVHGKFLQKPNNHILGQGCPECGKVKKSNSKRKSLEEYIKILKNVHNNKYNYSKLVYNGYHGKSDIVCETHGIFSQIFSQHLRGFGCPKCKYEKFSIKYSESSTGWSLTNWKKGASISKRFDGFKVYIIKCWNENEEFYKIGRTYLSVKYRFIGNLPYNYTILKEILGTAEEIFKLENKLKKENKNFKYIPKLEFGGMFECFSQVKY